MSDLYTIKQLAKTEAIQETFREAIIRVLRVRFELVPPIITDLLDRQDNYATLKQLHIQAVTIGSVEEFQQLLNQYISSESDNSVF
jgi:hypothetical protein